MQRARPGRSPVRSLAHQTEQIGRDRRVCRSRILWLVLLVLGAGVITQCAPAPRSGPAAPVTETATVVPSPRGTPATRAPVPSPTPTAPIVVDLKYQVLNRFPSVFFCDPDLYPVAHDVSDQ